MSMLDKKGIETLNEDTDSAAFQSKMNKAIQVISSKVSPYAVYLLGSAAKNRLRQDSDIDLAFLSDIQVGAYQCYELGQELADIFKREVDFINLNDASTVFKAQVIHTGKVILDRDADKRMLFEMRAFKSYALLNEEREEILKGVKERGRIYE